MSVIAMIVLCAAFPGGGPDSDLPLRLADDYPARVTENLSDQQTAPPVKDPPVDMARQENLGKNERDDGSMLINIAGRLRFTVPFGAANRSYTNYYYGYYYATNYTSWADLFNPGWGFEMEADFFFGKNGPGHRRSPGFNYGLALLFQNDEYYGRSANGAGGSHISLDDMNATSLQIGGRFIQALNTDFYYGGIVALGAVHYSEVEATITGPLAPGPTRDKIFRDTYTFASTFRMDGGYRLGPIGLTLGLGLRIMAPPSEGTNWSMNSGAFWTFDIDLGAEIGF